jgi:hypothetical protein
MFGSACRLLFTRAQPTSTCGLACTLGSARPNSHLQLGSSHLGLERRNQRLGRQTGPAHRFPPHVFKKGIKKLKLGKGVPVGNILKNGYLPPADRAGGVGPGTSHPSSGQEAPEGLFANKKFAKRSLRGHLAHPTGGMWS